MRKVTLSMKAQEKYNTIKRLAEGHISKSYAAVKIGCTKRHINRLLNRYRSEGKQAFLHGNTGRKPAHALSDHQKQEIITLYCNKYWDANFTHACELLRKNDDISISPSCLRTILAQEAILSPRATRRTRKLLLKKLEDRLDHSASKKEKRSIQESIVQLSDAHPRRPRCSYFGEMIQLDASVHLWFGDTKVYLHAAIDDSTGTIVGAHFNTQETLDGYYHVLYQILTEHGIPHMLYTDNRTVFEYKRKKIKEIEKDTFTQFGYACKQLGIELKTTSVAQAKGRIERLFQTLQSRLPVELRLKGVTTISEANVFLNSYIKEYNARFALPVHHNRSVFIAQPDLDIIHQTLAVLTPRVVDCGHCVRFQNQYYKTVGENGLAVCHRKGTRGLVIQTFTGDLLFSTQDQVYVLEEVPEHEKASRNFDINWKEEKPRKRYIPSPRHPWKRKEFLRHVPYDPVTEEMLMV